MYQASVIIPTHNRPHYLREALRSVVEQEGAELDVLVVGDGAGEDTAAVVAEFPTVRYVWQPQSGPNAARNHALSLARHDCVALLDDDDLWLPGKLQRQLRILEREPDAAYVFSNFRILRNGRSQANGLSTWNIPEAGWQALLGGATSGSRKPERIPPTAPPVEYYRVDLYELLLEHPYVLPTTAVFRKDFLTPDIRFVEHDYICGDWEFFARLSRDRPAIYMPDETACNRSHEGDGRLTRTAELVQLQCRLEMLERVWGVDSQFQDKADNRARLESTRCRYLLGLAKLQLRHGLADAAAQSLRTVQACGHEIPAALYLAGRLGAIPGALACLRGFERILLKARGSLRQ